jgi:hypothetical protein
MQSFASFLIIAISFMALSVSTAFARGNFDGPAELPRVTVASSMAATPAPGSIVSVRAGGNLQAALDNAFCGDTIELQAGATFTGRFLLRAKSCDAGHWIVIRTSAPDSALPPEGQRLTPCYAGLASLPGRPQYKCANPHNATARVQNNTAADGPFVLRTGANHYRLIGLEITRTVGGNNPPVLVSIEPLGVADHIVIDRSWLHGTTHDETQAGVSLIGANSAAVVDSYFSDFHCTQNTGACTDAHAIGGGNGNHQDGPFKISNNFLEAAGEAVMFGGGAATLTPADIEIRHNHFFKPWQWMPGNANFVGGAGGRAFIVKNHLELKNATRVLIEANLMENNWGGFTQAGYAVLLNPKSQHTQNNGDVCPLCQVTDVTVRYTRISHAGGGMQLMTSISGNKGNGGPALAGTRWSIHDVVIDDIRKKYVGGGNLFLIANGWEKNPVNTITINHVTGFPDSNAHLLLIGNQITNPRMYGFIFTNNLITTGDYPVWSSGGGLTSCSAKGTPAQKIAKCFSTYTFKNNALIASPAAFPPSSWPAGNSFPADANAAGITQYEGGDGGDYRLQPNSRYKNAGTDGRDLGADIVALEAALLGVE